MSAHFVRTIALAIAISFLSISSAHASGSTVPTPKTTSDSVTGGDPEPTSPDVIDAILAILHLA